MALFPRCETTPGAGRGTGLSIIDLAPVANNCLKAQVCVRLSVQSGRNSGHFLRHARREAGIYEACRVFATCSNENGAEIRAVSFFLTLRDYWQT
jgi:hypothetical protein